MDLICHHPPGSGLTHRAGKRAKNDDWNGNLHLHFVAQFSGLFPGRIGRRFPVSTLVADRRKLLKLRLLGGKEMENNQLYQNNEQEAVENESVIS